MGSRRRCCCSGCSVTICVKCGSSAIVPATVTIKNGGTTVGTCTTVVPGCCAIDIGTSGTYTVIVSATGYPTVTQLMTLMCGHTYTIGFDKCTGCFPASNLTMSWTQFGTPASGTLTYSATPYPNWTLCPLVSPSCLIGGSLICQNGELSFCFSDWFSGSGYSCCYNSCQASSTDALVLTNYTCGSAPLLTFAWGTLTPGGECWVLQTDQGFDNIQVSL